jgi:hypothetical protein
MMQDDILLLNDRLNAFSRLGELLSSMYNENQGKEIGKEATDSLEFFRSAIGKASANPWFTLENIKYAIMAWSQALSIQSLNQWVSPYKNALEKTGRPGKVAVIMAGNIPLVGMHDFLCTLITGNQFVGKLSTSDLVLLPALSRLLIRIEPRFEKMISFTEDRLPDFDAVIATGSNNTSRYFEFYFSRYPHIIRKNRNSVAVLTGSENQKELDGLSKDICLYFGMGCRNVSKVFLPSGYDPGNILEACKPFSDKLFNHFKYMNNYIYQKTIMQMNLLPFLDNGVLLMVNSPAYSSPISVVNYEFYESKDGLNKILLRDKGLLQCISSTSNAISGRVTPGSTQNPDLWDYADGIDTIEFLLEVRNQLNSIVK